MSKRYNITDDQLRHAVSISLSFRDVLNNLGIRITGGSSSHYKRRIVSLGIDFSHFKGKGHGKGGSRSDKSDILVLRDSGLRAKHKTLKRALIESGVSYICSECGLLPEWMGIKLTLDVDHINENWLDDRIDNLRFLCPNCHSQFSRNLR